MGRILFFTGEGAFVGGSGRAHVSAAKMGLVGFARGLASEFAPVGTFGSMSFSSPGKHRYAAGRIRSGTAIGRRARLAYLWGGQGKAAEIAATCFVPGQ